MRQRQVIAIIGSPLASKKIAFDDLEIKIVDPESIQVPKFVHPASINPFGDPIGGGFIIEVKRDRS